MNSVAFAPGDPIWMLAPELTCESPIEERFLEALVARCEAQRVRAVVQAKDRLYPVGRAAVTTHMWIHQQKQVGRFRCDFVLCADDLETGADSGPLVVECDGHDYHERTKDQAIRDRSRDRQMQAWGAPVFRFTGSEIHRNAAGCADQCIAFLRDRLQENA